MRVRALLGGILGSVTVLVVGWEAGAAAAHNAELAASAVSNTAAANTAATNTAASSSGSTTPSAAPSSASPTPTPKPSSSSRSSSSPSSAKSGTFTGSTSNTQFGPVQVKIVVASGKITNVVPVQLTNRDGRSQQISNYAAPILRQEVLKAQSAKVNTVGGATYTSDAYLSSLQSAITRAGL